VAAALEEEVHKRVAVARVAQQGRSIRVVPQRGQQEQVVAGIMVVALVVWDILEEVVLATVVVQEFQVVPRLGAPGQQSRRMVK
jgi:di/tricarboxylate transporter